MIAVSKATLVGVVYNLEMRETKSRKAMLKFSLKVWRPGGDRGDKVSYLPVVAYSSSAEILGRYMKEGKIVYLDCQIDTYKDQSGSEKFQFIVEHFSFLGNRDDA
ncbi:MAG: single-stranded DNA-binding protein [Dolichospermum sp.]|nr:single-stranded DNA-binding protein [Dolichospermum sp.]